MFPQSLINPISRFIPHPSLTPPCFNHHHPSVPSCSHNPSPPLPVHAVSYPQSTHLFSNLLLLLLLVHHLSLPCRPHTVTPTAIFDHPRSWLGFSNFWCLSPCPCTASAILLFPPLGSWVTPFSRHSQSNPTLVLQDHRLQSFTFASTGLPCSSPT
ncbi:hypothetical protein BDP55DRAFT_289019 [Colletotrichum godetiae]|uniref:Uncharacterized protein n=1 Tax=Colletotrichum godetiae TaxID=1209918 RepID=A0AAJ0ACX7_9PEZI|nr:uncharacterized protein BDP55DRAFT_289019 [Colletotrichum godetiae]KAK1671628.1 hypothetical protein BDP55DRAFT_289019 [Colletotrichum godetiae]